MIGSDKPIPDLATTTLRPPQVFSARTIALESPAYFVNANFELEWWNSAAEKEFLADVGRLPTEISARSVFQLLLGSGELSPGRREALLFHLSIAKHRLSKAALLSANAGLSGAMLDELGRAYEEAAVISARTPASVDVNLATGSASECWFTLYAAFFREGVLFSYAPALDTGAAVASLLCQRDVIIRDILKRRRPYLTKLAVLVADLESSVQICAELPPEEYFELINEVWRAMGNVLRKYSATHGKHVGDGLVYYFLPQPDSHYIFNAIRCAQEMRETMTLINARWKERKSWFNTLRLNIGLDEGEEWFGTYQTPSHLEFSALGDTINRTARLSDFARGGTIWTSKAMLLKLSAAERVQVPFGIRRAVDGEEIVVPVTFARVSNLIDLRDASNRKLTDIAGLTVTEILIARPGAGAGHGLAAE